MLDHCRNECESDVKMNMETIDIVRIEKSDCESVVMLMNDDDGCTLGCWSGPLVRVTPLYCGDSLYSIRGWFPRLPTFANP